VHGVKIDSLLNRPRSDVKELGAGQGETLCFIIDQVRQPDALARLYGLGQPLEPISLYMGTEFEALAQQGAIWVGGATTPELKALAADLCIERNAGICLLTNDIQQALAHARWLLKANDGTGGQSLLSYYRAELWAALASTAKVNKAQLMGPWSAVLSPAPRYVGSGQEGWMEWRSEMDKPSVPAAAPFNLPAECSAAQRLFAWVYWVDEHFHQFGKPQDENLREIVANLALLSEHRITQGRHLFKLSQLICGSLLQTRADVLGVLKLNCAAFLKVQQLEKLPVVAVNRASSAQDEWSHHGIC
tara:strand:+ start:214 stop:1122 length:909 start_codon:yes stop_codon:yes gene_type:complete